MEAIRLLIDEPQPGVRNMAIDEALMRSAGEERGVTLRFYGWEPGCLSFGRNQQARGAYDREAAAERDLDVVRRPTGGRAVLHHRELTYSMTAPADAWGSLRETYRRINRALADGLRGLGVPVDCAGDPALRERAPRPTARACFRDALPGEVSVGGRKLIGSAQWRNAGAFLQHGSLLLVDDQHVVNSLRAHRGPVAAEAPDSADAAGAAAQPAVPTGAVALTELLPAPPAPLELASALVGAFEREFGTQVRDGLLRPHELALAEELEERYADPSWTWRR